MSDSDTASSTLSRIAPIDPPRSTQHGANASVAMSVALGCTVYVLAHWLGFPRPYYLPTTGRWSFGPSAEAIAMGYYGLLGYAFAGALAGLGIASLPGVRWRIRSASGAAVLSKATIGVVFGSLAYFVVVELATWGP